MQTLCQLNFLWRKAGGGLGLSLFGDVCVPLGDAPQGTTLFIFGEDPTIRGL